MPLLSRYFRPQRSHGTEPGHQETDIPSPNTKASKKSNKIGNNHSHHSLISALGSSLHLPHDATPSSKTGPTAKAPATATLTGTRTIPSTHFPFLNLPRELRDLIYDHLRQSSASTIHIKHCWQIPTSPPYDRDWISFPDPGPYFDDPIPLQPSPISGILSYHATSPPLALRLTCRQIHRELWENFFSTRFEVGL